MPNKIKSARDKIKEKKDQLRASLFEVAQKRRELPYKRAAQPFYDAATEAENKGFNAKSSYLDIQQEGDERFLLPTENPLSYKDAEDGLGVTVTATPVRKRGTVEKTSVTSSLSSFNKTSTDAGEYIENRINTPHGDIIDTDYEVYGGGSSYGTSYPSFGNLPNKSFNYGSGYSPRDKSLFRLFTEAYINKQ